MAVPNNFTEISDGDFPRAGYYNDFMGVVLTGVGLNTIRAIMTTADLKFNTMTTLAIDGFGDSFPDASGQDEHVNTSNSTAIFDTDSYIPSFVTTGSEETKNFDTTNNSPAGLTTTITINTAGIFTSIRFYAISADGGGTVDVKKNGNVIATSGVSSGAGTKEITFTDADYSDFLESGDTCVIEITPGNGTLKTKTAQSYAGTLFSISNQEVACDATGDEYGYTEVEGDDGIVELTIPTGKFPSDISTGFATALVKNFESGANIQWQFANAGESSGYHDIGSVANFTAFTSEPTKLQIKLVVKGSSPTILYPAIYGAWGYAK